MKIKLIYPQINSYKKIRMIHILLMKNGVV